MNNAQIIFSQSLNLMEAGLIGTTGRQLELTMADGSKKMINEPEPIHTFQYWKPIGYMVKKGEHAVAKFPVWKYSEGKKKKEDTAEAQEEAARMFMKMSAWFPLAQVEKMQGGR